MFDCGSIERQFMDEPACHFLRDESFISKQVYVPNFNSIENLLLVSKHMCQTSIPYSKNGLMREQFNVFIIAQRKYLDNFNNMLTDLDIFRAITST